MKTCTLCKIDKPESAYHKHAGSKSGLHPRCKECRKIESKQRHAEKPETCAKWRKENPNWYIYLRQRNGAKRRGIPFNLLKEHFDNLRGSTCHYCGDNTVTGFDRIDSSLGYSLDNVVPCCKLCNQAKNNLTTEEFFALVQRIYRRHQLEQRDTTNDGTPVQVPHQRD